MRNKYKVIDLFCGCGGISVGFELAGFEIIGGIDFNSDATNTFQNNFKNAKVHCIDITTIKDSQILDEYKGVDVIIGGPPCQGFSSANRWQKEMDDPRNKLFYQYIRFVTLLRPKALLIENVRGILTRDNGYAKDRILKLLDNLGYSVNVKILDASLYGVPQNRKRAVFVGIRKDFLNESFDFDNLKVLKKVTVKEAIGDLYELEKIHISDSIPQKKPVNDYLSYVTKGSQYVTDHEIRYPALKVQERISYVKQGENWQQVPEYLWPSKRNNRHSSAYKRLKEDDQSCTIDTGNAHSNYFHPLFNRIPTIRESARLQSFPDRFEFTGSRGSKYKQIGNAVPPLMAKAIAEVLKIYIDKGNENH